MPFIASGFTLQREDGLTAGTFLRYPDFAKHSFVFGNIFFQRTKQTFSMLGHKNDTRLDTSLRHARQHFDKIENKF